MSETLVHEHRANVLAAIMLSATALEATANEFFADNADARTGARSGVPQHQRELLSRMWSRGVPRSAKYSILEKYQLALTMLQLPEFDEGQAPFQDAKLLTTLRNAIMHYEPEWQAQDSPDSSSAHRFKLAARGKFKDNALAAPGNPYYPDKLLGHGCAEWAVSSSLTFMDAFFSRLKHNPPYGQYRSLLSTT